MPAQSGSNAQQTSGDVVVVIAIAIVVSSALGAIMGIVQVLVFGASVVGGILTYFSVAIALSGLALVAAAMRGDTSSDASDATLAHWQDWHEEEDWQDATLEDAAGHAPVKNRA